MGNGKHKPGPTGLHAKGGATATAPSMADQIVGYARRQSGTRVGDGAKVAILELVGYEFKRKEKKEKAKKEEPAEAAS